MADTPHKLLEWARDAKMFISESGEALICDELLMRATVAYNMLLDRGMLMQVAERDRHWNRAHAIALIAHNFDDNPPCTPHRVALFTADIDSGRMTEVSRG